MDFQRKPASKTRSWNYRCIRLKNKNKQTYHGKRRSRAMAINRGSKHVQTALAKRRKWCFVYCSSDLSGFTQQIPGFIHTPSANVSPKFLQPLKEEEAFYCGNIALHPTANSSGHAPQHQKRTEWHTIGSSLWTWSKWELMLVYACAVLGLTTVYCKAWMWVYPVMHKHIFVLNCVAVHSSIYLGQ